MPSHTSHNVQVGSQLSSTNTSVQITCEGGKHDEIMIYMASADICLCEQAFLGVSIANRTQVGAHMAVAALTLPMRSLRAVQPDLQSQ